MSDRPFRDRLPDVATTTAIAGELAAYVATALAMLWPVTLSLGSRFAGWHDAPYYTWASWRAGEMLSSGDLGLRIRDIVWPYGIDLRHLDGQLPTLIGGLWNVVASPELAHNLGLLTGVGLNLWAGRRLGKACSSHRAVWALVAIAFATAPAIAARLEVHYTMLFAFPVALLIEEAIVVGRGDRAVRPLRLGVLLAVAFLCGIYFLVFGGIAFAMIVLLATTPRRLPPALLRSAGGLLLALVVVSPFVLARLELDRSERAAGRDPTLLTNTFRAAADGLAVVTQPVTATLQLPGMDRMREHFRRSVHESTIFPGFPLLLAVGGLLLLRSPLRWPLLFTALSIWVLALGTSMKIDGRFVLASGDRPVAWLPYTALMDVPGLASLRSPNRASFTLAAVLAAAFAICLGWLFARYARAWQHAAITAAGGAVLAANLLVPIHQGSIATSPELEAALRTVSERVRPGESMIEVPADCGRQTDTVVMQILHRTPLVGCQTSYAAIPWASGIEAYKRSAAYAALRCRPSRIAGRVRVPFTRGEGFDRSDVDSLRRVLGARFFLIDRDRAGDPGCAHVLEAVGVLEGAETIGGDDVWTVIDTGPIRRSASP